MKNVTVRAFLCSINLKKGGNMNYLLILIVLFCPWLIPVAIVLLLLYLLYQWCAVLFWILIVAFIILCIVAVNYTSNKY